MHSAKLIAISKTLGELEHLTPEEFIVYTARVSSPKNQGNLDTSVKLLKYLISHGHFSPLQMVTATLEITTTRAISRQLLRHRSLNFQEFSFRYAEMSDEMVANECRMQDTKNRQNSIISDDEDCVECWQAMQEDTWNIAIENYQEALNRGIAKEVARSLLPEGLVASTLYVTGTIRDLMFYLKARLDVSTQKEHRVLASSMVEELWPYFPNVLEAMGIINN